MSNTIITGGDEVSIRSKEVKFIRVSDVRPNPRNRNTHFDDQIDRLCEIIKYQGFRSPLIISNQSGLLVAGHGRLMAAKKIGMESVPAIFQDFDNEEQEYAAMVSENSIAAWAELDLSAINADIPELGPDFDIDMLGLKNFTIEALDSLLGDEDAIPQAPKEARSKPGDIYEIGKHRVMCGSSAVITDMEKLMGNEKVDLIFTDPPYGVNYQEKNKMLNSLQSPKGGLETEIHGDDMSLEDLKQMLLDSFSNASTFLADKSSYYVCAPQGGELGMMMMMMMMQEAGVPCRHMIVWVKNNAAFSMGRLDYDYRHEPILYGWMKNKTHEFYGGGDFKNSVWEIDRENNKLHPTMKPVAIMENAIRNSAPPNGIVLDIFGGSGSTLIAAEKTGRSCRMIEINPSYCDVIVSRFCEQTGIREIKRNGESLTW